MDQPQLSLFVLCIISAGNVSAVPTLGDVMGNSSLSYYSDSGASAGRMGTSEATVFLLKESAGLKETNSVGIYSFVYSPNDGAAVLQETLELFNGESEAISSVTLRFDQDGQRITNVSTNDSIGLHQQEQFGIYLKNESENGGFTWYSHGSLNWTYVGDDPNFSRRPGDYFDPIDDFLFEDHSLIFDTSDNTHGSLLGSDLVFAFEDLCSYGCNSDYDYNDLVIGINSVTIPGPNSPPLIALTLTMLYWIRNSRYSVVV